MTATPSVNVSGLSSTTSEKSLNDFFTFCGTITSIEYNEAAKSAVVHFEKSSAAKTALMLNGGTLDGATLAVSSEKEHEDEHPGTQKDGESDQADKPRAAIVAEYLAKGYVLSDDILHRAIEIDSKQGISSRFLAWIKSLDTTVGAKALGPEQTISGKVQSSVSAATQQARAVDEQKGYSKIAGDYYSKALSSPFGKKVFDFYTTTSKQVFDIHEEASRIAAAHKSESATPATSDATAATAAEPAPAAPVV